LLAWRSPGLCQCRRRRRKQHLAFWCSKLPKRRPSRVLLLRRLLLRRWRLGSRLLAFLRFREARGLRLLQRGSLRLLQLWHGLLSCLLWKALPSLLSLRLHLSQAMQFGVTPGMKALLEGLLCLLFLLLLLIFLLLLRCHCFGWRHPLLLLRYAACWLLPAPMSGERWRHSLQGQVRHRCINCPGTADCRSWRRDIKATKVR